MRIIIAGDGKVGSTLTRQLAAEGYDITIIDANPKVLEMTEELYDVMCIQGNCASMDVLLQAGVMEADLLIVATSADEINLLCSLTAHGLNPKIHTIARIRNPEYRKQLAKMRDTFALSLTVNPEYQAAVEIERLMKYPGFLKRDTFAKGRVEIVELRVKKNGKLCDVALNDLPAVVGCQILVCTVLRDGQAVAPDGNYILREGDRVFVTAPSENLMDLLKSIGIITKKIRRVMICGGGRIGYYLAKRLERTGIRILLIEKDYNRCLELAAMLPEACVVHGDASDEKLLDHEGVADCDVLITMTGIDELNMIISLYGSVCGVPQVITKLGRMENPTLLDRVPLGSTISPKDLCCNTIVRYVRAMKNQTGAAISVHSIADGQAEALEFRADRNTRHCGESLKNLRLKKNTLIVCITHGGKQVIPNGESCFHEGDTVIVVSGSGEVIYQLNDIFEG